jgi:pyruvate/2-oxoglutarate dehydrogenase complex dihydrolipoamide acyltransferase (E2) component
MMAVQPMIMPKLGAYTEDILLAEWLVPEGAQVASGDGVFELETDKTTAEVTAEAAGFVHRLVEAGEKVPIGATVGLVAETREEYASVFAAGAKAPAVASPPPAAELRTAGATARASAARRREAAPVSPRARALLGLSVEHAAEIPGSGPGGRILDRDVAAWADARSGTPGVQPGAAGELTVTGTIPLRGRRATIAGRMLSSLQTSAQLTSVLELDMKPLVEFRSRLNEEGASPRIGITSIIVKLVAAALRDHPVLNARVTEAEVELLSEINIAVAVDTPEGLVAPVVHDADLIALEEVNGRIADLALRARDGSLQPADVAGATFTVSNGGIHPVDITTAILNPPQCGILWIGRVRDRPVVVDGSIAVRPTVQACLTFDHRAVDGGPAAAFLGTLEASVAALPRLPA